MKRYKIVLEFKDGKEIESIILNYEPSEEEIKRGMRLYKADSYRIETI